MDCLCTTSRRASYLRVVCSRSVEKERGGRGVEERRLRRPTLELELTSPLARSFPSHLRPTHLPSSLMDLALVIFLLVLSTEFLNWVGKSFLIDSVSFPSSVDERLPSLSPLLSLADLAFASFLCDRPSNSTNSSPPLCLSPPSASSKATSSVPNWSSTRRRLRTSSPNGQSSDAN